MRWFWLFILGLCVLTGGLYAQRTRTERAAEQALQAQMEEERAESSTARRPRRERETTTPAGPATSAPVIAEPIVEDQPEQIAESTPEPESVEIADETETTSESTTQAFNPGAIMETMQALKDQLPDKPHARNSKPTTEITPAQGTQIPEPTGEIVIDLPTQDQPAPADEPKGPSYELRADGSFKVLDANQWVQGSGTEADPFVLGWEVLRSIEKNYDQKNGNDTLPDWLDLLEGKFVTIEGNTSASAAYGSAQDREGHGVYRKLRPTTAIYKVRDWINE
jgi:hypothetical protein